MTRRVPTTSTNDWSTVRTTKRREIQGIHFESRQVSFSLDFNLGFGEDQSRLNQLDDEQLARYIEEWINSNRLQIIEDYDEDNPLTSSGVH